jgi:hypothetical protein
MIVPSSWKPVSPPAWRPRFPGTRDDHKPGGPDFQEIETPTSPEAPTSRKSGSRGGSSKADLSSVPLTPPGQEEQEQAIQLVRALHAGQVAGPVELQVPCPRDPLTQQLSDLPKIDQVVTTGK